jgi:acetolactate synthase I/II/III large subunit
VNNIMSKKSMKKIKTTTKSGADLVLHALKKEGVRAVFGYPGGAVIDIFDKLYSSDIQFFMTRHEQGAVHAADGFARASGEVGVCIATSGPGATNLVTGLATAHMDSIPLVAITGQVHTFLIGNDAFQEADMVGISRSITKHNFLVDKLEDLPRILKSAFYIARTGRPGPVLVDIPKDIQQAKAELEYPETIEIRSYKPTVTGHFNQIKRVAAAINSSERPTIFAGGGVVSSGASEELRELARIINAPVTTSLMGLGTFPETDQNALKMVGMHGTEYANYAIQECDLLIAIGVRFDDRVTGVVAKFAPNAQIVHIDIDPTSIRKNVEVSIPVVGDIKNVLSELNAIVKPKEQKEWTAKVLEWKEKFPLNYGENGGIQPQEVIRTVAELTNHEAIIATEVGQNQMWTAQFYDFVKPRTFLTSGGLGTMGYGFPAAIGAQVAKPDSIVIDIAGDGSIQMNIQELATAVLYQIPVKIVILNNQSLGMVRQWQQIFYDQRFSHTCLRRDITCPAHCDQNEEQCPVDFTPNFTKLAEAYGATGLYTKDPKEVRPVLEKMLSTPGPVLAEFVIAKEENVYPMVPAGAALHEMIRGIV